MRQAETRRRADMVIEWLEANPTGCVSKDIAQAIGLGLNTTQRLMTMLVRAGDTRLVVLGAGAYLRYAAPRHKETTRAYMDAVIDARRTRWSRVVAKRRELEQQAEEMAQANGYERGETMHQVIMREWTKPVKLGPASVFELAQS